MKYSVCTDCIYENLKPWQQALADVKKAGYDYVEFWTWWDKDMDEFKRIIRDLNLGVAAFCSKFVDPGDITLQGAYLEGLRESIEMAQKLDCKTLIVQAGWEWESFPKGINRMQHRSALLNTMKKAAGIAERSDMTLVIEPLNNRINHPGYHMSTSDDAFDFVEKIGSPNFKVLFDLYHQQVTEGNLLKNISDHIDKIGHFHAAGSPGRTEITKGEIHYSHVFEEIIKLGYDGYIGLEYLSSVDPLPGLIEAHTVLVDETRK